MFSQYGSRKPFNPGLPQQSGQPTSNQGSRSSFSHQIRPDFMQPTQQQNSGSPQSPAPIRRVQQDHFQRLSPESQRAALYDHARQQMNLGRQPAPRDLTSALPGGLTQRQRMDFDMLRRTNPQAAEQQLLHYQRTADIRHNKPTTGPSTPPPAGPTYRKPPTNLNGPRRTSL